MPFSPLIFSVYGNDQERDILLPDMHTTLHYTHGGPPHFCSLSVIPQGYQSLWRRKLSIWGKRNNGKLFIKATIMLCRYKFGKFHWLALQCEQLSLFLTGSLFQAEDWGADCHVLNQTDNTQASTSPTALLLVTGTHISLGVYVCTYLIYMFQVQVPLTEIIHGTHLEIIHLLNPMIDQWRARGKNQICPMRHSIAVIQVRKKGVLSHRTRSMIWRKAVLGREQRF